jgi:dimethylglycine dehydrogenase
MDFDVFQKAQNGGEDGAIRIEDVTAASGVFLLAGPNARAVLERAAKAENIGGIAPMRGRRAEINLAPALVLRLAFTGEAGYEIHHPLACQNRIFDALLSAGEDLRLRPFGFYALDSMRLEKSHPVIGRELSAEFNALESGLEKFVDFAKGDFVGREALLKIREKPGGATLATLEVAAPGDADALGGNPVFADGKIIGRATSGNYGHRVGKSLALAMLRADAVNIGDDVEIEILGVRKKARVIPPSPFDSGGEKSRA